MQPKLYLYTSTSKIYSTHSALDGFKMPKVNPSPVHPTYLYVFKNTVCCVVEWLPDIKPSPALFLSIQKTVFWLIARYMYKESTFL